MAALLAQQTAKPLRLITALTPRGANSSTNGRTPRPTCPIGLPWPCHHGTCFFTHSPPQQAVERQTDHQPSDRPDSRFFGIDHVRAVLAQHHKIDEERGRHNGREKHPQPHGLGCTEQTGHADFLLERYGVLSERFCGKVETISAGISCNSSTCCVQQVDDSGAGTWLCTGSLLPLREKRTLPGGPVIGAPVIQPVARVCFYGKRASVQCPHAVLHGFIPIHAPCSRTKSLFWLPRQHRDDPNPPLPAKPKPLKRWRNRACYLPNLRPCTRCC